MLTMWLCLAEETSTRARMTIIPKMVSGVWGEGGVYIPECVPEDMPHGGWICQELGVLVMSPAGKAQN